MGMGRINQKFLKNEKNIFKMTPFHNSIQLKVDYEQNLEFSSSVFPKIKTYSNYFFEDI